MQSTPVYGLPYPEAGTDSPNGADQIQALAEATEAALVVSTQQIVGDVAPTNAATTTTTEAFRGTITANLSAGRKYLLQYWGECQSTAAGDLMLIRLRYESGASVTSSGTLIQAMAQHAAVASRNQSVALGKSFTVPVDGQYTVGVSIQRNGGTGGNVKLDFADDLVEPYLLLTDIGAAS